MVLRNEWIGESKKQNQKLPNGDGYWEDSGGLWEQNGRPFLSLEAILEGSDWGGHDLGFWGCWEWSRVGRLLHCARYMEIQGDVCT